MLRKFSTYIIYWSINGNAVVSLHVDSIVTTVVKFYYVAIVNLQY